MRSVAILVGASTLSACGGNGSTTGTLADAGVRAPVDAGSGAPVDAAVTTAPLRLSFSAEDVTPESEPGLDGKGTLLVQVFDSPTPPANAPGAVLGEGALPADALGGGEVSVLALPDLTLALRDPPATVYVRAVFFDQGPTATGGFGAGTWLGGEDLSAGFSRTAPLLPVRLAGAGDAPHVITLTALRRVRVTVTRSVAPIGDGQGSLSVTASRDALLPPRAATFGYGIDPCVDLARGDPVVDIGVVGAGSFWIAAFFDDLGLQTPGAMPPGTMVSVRNVNLTTGEGTFDRLVLAPSQYSAAITVDLGYVLPLPRGSGPLGPNSCVDLGYAAADAGP